MKKVLVVDDSVFMRIYLKSILEKNGYNVVGEAHSGVVAFEMVKELMPDIVTMDITMPNENGVHILKKILAFTSSIKVVMVTTTGQEAAVDEALRYGAKGFLKKPFKEDVIIKTLEDIRR